MNTRPAKYRTRDPDPSANPIHIHQSDTNPSAHHSTRGSTFSSYSTNTHHLREGSHRVIQGYIPSDRVLLILLQGRKQKPIRNPAAIQNPIAIRVQSVNARPAKYRTRTGPTTHPIVTSNTTTKMLMLKHILHRCDLCIRPHKLRQRIPLSRQSFNSVQPLTRQTRPQSEHTTSV